MDNEVAKLNENLGKLLEAYRKNENGARKWVFRLIALVFVVFMCLVPVLAITGNAAGAVVLGLFAMMYFVFLGISKVALVISLAILDGEVEKVTHRKRNSAERLKIT